MEKQLIHMDYKFMKYECVPNLYQLPILFLKRWHLQKIIAIWNELNKIKAFQFPKRPSCF
jgi:hypothetical protein